MDIASVDLNLLVAFDALSTERAVTRAGARVGLSQPAMSNALLRLRRLFDDDLFVRTPSGMEPTARARELARAIGPALSQLKRALEPPLPFDATQSERTFAAGMAEYAEIALLEALSRDFRARAPQADLTVLPTTWTDFAARLDAGTLDVVVGNIKRIPPRFESTRLLDDRLVCLARAGHPALRRRLPLRDYARLVHVLLSPTGLRKGAVDEALAEKGLTRRIALTVGTYLALALALTGSDLVATVPERTAKRLAKMADLAVLPLPLAEVARISMVWHRKDAGDPAHTWFRALIERAAAAS